MSVYNTVKPLLNNIPYNRHLVKLDKNLRFGLTPLGIILMSLRNPDTFIFHITDTKICLDCTLTNNKLRQPDACLPLPQNCCWMKWLDYILAILEIASCLPFYQCTCHTARWRYENVGLWPVSKLPCQLEIYSKAPKCGHLPTVNTQQWSLWCPPYKSSTVYICMVTYHCFRSALIMNYVHDASDQYWVRMSG